METLKLIIHGQPITKKNSQQIILIKGRPLIIQSKAYRAYEKLAKAQIWESRPYIDIINKYIWVCCRYYLATARIPDLVNLLGATADILQAAKVIQDDNLIRSWDGSRIAGKDPVPRVEIEIREISEGGSEITPALDIPW